MPETSADFNNHTQAAAAVAHRNLPALICGISLIVTVAGGNVLVCLSVYLEKALKTTTNYFIVSLAFADLLLALLVLPLFVYAEVSPEPGARAPFKRVRSERGMKARQTHQGNSQH